MMFRITTTTWTVLLVILISEIPGGETQSAGTVVVQGETKAYSCRRFKMGCKNDGKCVSGVCDCKAGFVGHDCGVDTATVGCTTTVCSNEGICYTEAGVEKCYCPPTHYGQVCDKETDFKTSRRKRSQDEPQMRIFHWLPVYIAPDIKQYTWECLGTEMKVSIMVPDVYSGDTYVSTNRLQCGFSVEDSGVPGYKNLSRSIPFDNSTCSAIPKENYPQKDDVTYMTDIVVGFHPFIQLRTDRTITLNCTHTANNVSMQADLNSDANEREHLTRTEDKKTYSPVRFQFLDKDDKHLQRTLTVGEEFTNIAYLISTKVYEDLLLERCVASNGISGENKKEVILLNRGCPTDVGKMVMVDPPGQKKRTYQASPTSSEFKAVGLEMLGFRFHDSHRVYIKCVVKICKPKYLPSCVIPQCDSGEVGAQARKKRSSDLELISNNATDEETVTALFTISDRPVLIQEKQIVKPHEVTDCFQSKEIIVVIIVMSVVVLLMLMACVVLATLIFRSRGKVRKLVQNNGSQDQRFRIPRAKISC